MNLVIVAAIEAMRDAGCCPRTMARAVEGGETPGALWHIYDPNDSDKIRQLLRTVKFCNTSVKCKKMKRHKKKKYTVYNIVYISK